MSKPKTCVRCGESWDGPGDHCVRPACVLGCVKESRTEEEEAIREPQNMIKFGDKLYLMEGKLHRVLPDGSTKIIEPISEEPASTAVTSTGVFDFQVTPDFSHKIGEQWCRVDKVPPGWCVAVQCCKGFVVLCAVERWTKGMSGGMRLRPLRWYELPAIEIDL